jgi:heme/copper-type cytochrome/quinol oxidase subunit 3
MALYHFHRVLISATLIFGGGFLAFLYRRWSLQGQPSNLAMAGVTLALMVAMTLYLANFNRKLRALERALAAATEAR